MAPRIVGLIGATASGKTAVSMDVARAVRRDGIEVEIVVLDSRQLYRGLDVGTGKPSPDEREEVRHHLLDVLDVTASPDAMQYRNWATEALSQIVARGNVPLLVGGSGFYLRALKEGFHTIDATEAEREAVRRRVNAMDDETVDVELRRIDPSTHARLHANDRYRRGRALEIALLTGEAPSVLEASFEAKPVLGATFDLVHLQVARAALHERITRRTAQWLDSGWAEEVRGFLDDGVAADAPGLDILGYRDVVARVRGEVDAATAVERIDTGTRRYARAQETWFGKESVRARGDDAVATEALRAALRAHA